MLDKKKRYEKILKFTSDYISKNGYSPTLSEIAKKAGISVSSTYRYVKTLESAGLIDSGGGKKRKITLKSENVKGRAIPVPVFSEIVFSIFGFPPLVLEKENISQPNYMKNNLFLSDVKKEIILFLKKRQKRETGT